MSILYKEGVKASEHFSEKTSVPSKEWLRFSKSCGNKIHRNVLFFECGKIIVPELIFYHNGKFRFDNRNKSCCVAFPIHGKINYIIGTFVVFSNFISRRGEKTKYNGIVWKVKF